MIHSGRKEQNITLHIRTQGHVLQSVSGWNCSLWVTTHVKPIHPHTVPQVHLFYLHTCTAGCIHNSQMLDQIDLMLLL